MIPLGTANVLAHELALPFAPRAVAAALAFGRTRTLWPGVARGADGARLFVQMLGVGFDAQVVHLLSLPLKRVLGRGAYVVQTCARPGATGSPRCICGSTGWHDRGGQRGDQQGPAVQAENSCWPRSSRPAEPGFSVVLFGCGGPAAALMYGAALPVGRLGRAPGVRHLRARCVEVVGNAPIPAQADGDAAGFTPLSVADAPGPIEVVTG